MSSSPNNKKDQLRVKIEAIVSRDCCTYIEALALYMSDNNILPSKMAKMICPKLMEHIKEEVRTNRMIRPSVMDAFAASGGEKDEDE